MTYVECCKWLVTQGYNSLLVAGWTVHGCSKASDYRPLSEQIEIEATLPPERQAQQFFVEVRRNGKGEPAPHIYAYPRPASMDTDISWALDLPSKLPPERLVENIDPRPDCYEAPSPSVSHACT